jgi:hypothetical protein
MTDRSNSPPPSWQHRVGARRPRRGHEGFSSARVTMGAIHMAGMIVGILAADRMKSPGARWSAIAGFSYASRAREVTFASADAEHHCDNAMQSKIGALYMKIEKAGSLIPLVSAIDKSDEAMKANPHKASNTIWSHTLAGMSGSYLNLTLDRSRKR